MQSNKEENVLLALVDFLAPLVIASSGVIVITPDTLGYGESYKNDYNRTYLTNLPSVQAWTVSYLAAQQYIANVTGGCTELAQTTAVGGYGHGGYAAVLAAISLEKLGIEVFQLYVGGAVLKLQTQFSFLVQQLGFANANTSANTNTNTSANASGISISSTTTSTENAEFPVSSRYYLESMLLFWVFSYSNAVPFVNPPSMVSSSWRARILQLSAPDPSVPVLSSSNAGANLLDLIHPDIVDFFEVCTTRPHV
jgi:hypothetical protein